MFRTSNDSIFSLPVLVFLKNVFSPKYDMPYYMIFNFRKDNQFNTRLYMDDNKINQVTETCLLGVIISDNLRWHSYTASLVKRCYQRIIILRNLSSLHVTIHVNIYCIYNRSVAEQSSVVWSSSITSREEYDLERIQKGFLYNSCR